MSGKTVVIDYGIGNVFSVMNALREIGSESVLTGDIATIRSADRLILPGVGAFARAMDVLQRTGIAYAVRDFVSTGRPFMGICIGMQVLMDYSTEFGYANGLGVVPGSVERIVPDDLPSKRVRVPHIGWAQLIPSTRGTERMPQTWAGYETDALYFVHSFHCKPADPGHLTAHVNYGGIEITAVIQKDNILGVQFHPERSGRAGLQMLREFTRR